MFGMGMPEILLILAIALVVIGPKKLPDLAKSLGRAMREFSRATSEFKDSLDMDGDLREVRQTFDEVNDEVSKAVTDDSPAAAPKSTSAESALPADEKLTTLKQAFDEMNPPTSPESDPAVDPEESAGPQEETSAHDR